MSNEDEVAQAKAEAAEKVVERVESWHEGADPQTLREKLAEGFAEAGVQVDQEKIAQMADEIHERGSTNSEQADPS